MAANLARSFLHWHAGSDIIFQLVTDLPDAVPSDLADKIDVITIQKDELGGGFSPKLHLDRLVSDGQTFFIDSDCLIFENLNLLFERFQDHDVSVVGGYIQEGEWFGQIESVCKRFNVPHIPKFNGGLYYIEKGSKASSVYATARELESSYDEIGFVRLRGHPNDEVLMALAMQLHGQTPIFDDGTIMSDPQACPGGYMIDVIGGRRWLYNPPPPHPLHRAWNPYSRVSPAIVHFLGFYTKHYPYKREATRLSRKLSNQLTWANEMAIILQTEYPERMKIVFKNVFRPLYHLLFGVRTPNQSERL